MPLDIHGLRQVGINNILIARANGMELTVAERLLLDQWCSSCQADERLRELCINEEIAKYDELGEYTGKDPRPGPNDEVNGDFDPQSKV